MTELYQSLNYILYRQSHVVCTKYIYIIYYILFNLLGPFLLKMCLFRHLNIFMHVLPDVVIDDIIFF